MRKIKEVLRLRFELGLGQRAIARACSISQSTVHEERQGETITWKAFGYENTYEDKIFLDAYSTVGPFTFDATTYERTLAQALDVLRRAKP